MTSIATSELGADTIAVRVCDGGFPSELPSAQPPASRCAPWSLFAPIAALLSIISAVSAAPPKVDSLYPAGGSRGSIVTVDVGKGIDPWPPQVWVSRPEVRVVPTSEKGKLEVTVPVDTVPGLCWLRCWNEEGASVQRPFVIGTLPEVLEADKNDDPAKPQVLDQASLVVNGAIEKQNDVDVFAVTLEAGQTLVADCVANRILGSPMDATLQVLSADGFVLVQNDDEVGLDPRIVFPAPAAGRYLVRIFAFPSQTDSTIGLAGAPGYVYRLTLTTGPFVDHAWPMSVSDVQAPVRLFGWNLPGDVSSTPLPEAQPVSTGLRDTTLVGRDDLGSLAEALLVDVPSIEESRAAPADVQSVTAPVCVTGRIATAGESDTYRFSGKKGESMLVRVESNELGFPLDPVVTLSDTTGKSLTRTDDVGNNRDAELVQALPADGEYTVSVSDLHGRSGPRFVYRLTIREPEPDFTASVAADNFVIQAGKPLEIPVTIQRRYGFTDEVEVTAVGLPEGATAAPVQSAGEGDQPMPQQGRRGRRRGGNTNAKASTAKLVIQSPAPVSGFFRIVVKSLDEAPLVRTVVVPTGIDNTNRPDLWLTVKP